MGFWDFFKKAGQVSKGHHMSAGAEKPASKSTKEATADKAEKSAKPPKKDQ